MATTLTAVTAPKPRNGRMTQQERSLLARQKLLDAAIALICDKGFALTTLAEIAAAAGVTRGAIQHHFEGRDELVLAILHEVENQIRASFEDALIDGGLPLADRISRLIDHLSAVGRAPAYLAAADIWMATRADPTLKDAVRDSVLRSSRSFRSLWQRAFDRDLPPAVISDCRRVLVALLRGLVLTRIFTPDSRSHELTVAAGKTMVLAYMAAASRSGAA